MRRREGRGGGEKGAKDKEDKEGHTVKNIESCIYINTHVHYVEGVYLLLACHA